MLILCYILFAVYTVAVNVYGAIILKYQKKERVEPSDRPIKDGKLFLTGLLGGALAIYIFMFIFKYRLKSLPLMLFMPLIVVLNAYFIILLFSTNFGFLGV